MDYKTIQSIVEDVVNQLSIQPLSPNEIPISVSARHCHLCQEDIDLLFGKGYQLTIKSELSQPGQFAANETITLIGPKGSIRNVRILGPTRSKTQVEISKTDAVKLGLVPPLRESGDIQGSSPATLLGPKGSIYIEEGLIIAQAHIHMPPETAQALDVSNGEYVKVTTESDRPVTFEKVLIRVSSTYILDMHIDTDEANSSLLITGQKGILRKVEDI